jgi:uncharacterized protein with FMN-binding domain
VAHSKSNKKVANSLVAMSSAAIVAVYSAGFVRTRPAANRFASEQSADLGPPAQAARATNAALRGIESPAPSAPLPVTSQAPAPSPVETKQSIVKAAKPATPLSAASSPQSQAEIVTPAPASTVSAPSTAANSTVADTPVAETAANPAATAPAVPVAPVWKDGKYTAWGTCRHGDIQATVVIEAGRILSAEITDCQTRYSCDVIEGLPAKTVSRQKAKFDHIGGATESAYAYFGAVYWALDQASK